jgi:hypothetical protein
VEECQTVLGSWLQIAHSCCLLEEPLSTNATTHRRWRSSWNRKRWITVLEEPATVEEDRVKCSLELVVGSNCRVLWGWKKRDGKDMPRREGIFFFFFFFVGWLSWHDSRRACITPIATLVPVSLQICCCHRRHVVGVGRVRPHCLGGVGWCAEKDYRKMDYDVARGVQR